MFQQFKSSHMITRIIYDEYMKDMMEKLEDAKNPYIVFVTDLVACSHKFHLRHEFPELTIKFEPAAIMGELIHSGLEELLKQKGFETEVSIEEKYKINGQEYYLKGRIDAYDPQNKVVVEIKSGRSTQNLPREHHVYQLQIYLNLLKAEKGILIYITPEKILEYSVKKEKIDIKSLMKMLIEDSIHPKWNWECKYCPFQKICPYKVSE